MRVLICGSRDWSKPIPIDVVVAGFAAVYGAAHVTVIHGAARGADSMAASAAHRVGVACEDYPADWATHGKAAGFIRNQRMLDEGKPEVVVAFTDDLATSRGTSDMVRRARAAGVPVYVMGRAGVPAPPAPTQPPLVGRERRPREPATGGGR
jgi:hypothetical protein